MDILSFRNIFVKQNDHFLTKKAHYAFKKGLKLSCENLYFLTIVVLFSKGAFWQSLISEDASGETRRLLKDYLRIQIVRRAYQRIIYKRGNFFFASCPRPFRLVQ